MIFCPPDLDFELFSFAVLFRVNLSFSLLFTFCLVISRQLFSYCILYDTHVYFVPGMRFTVVDYPLLI